MHNVIELNDSSQRPLTLSKYVHNHPVSEEIVGLYTPIGHEVTFIPSQVWNAVSRGHLRDIPEQIASDLVSRKFLAPSEFDKQALTSYAVPPVNAFYSLFLLVSGQCNMGCAYCVVDQHENDNQSATCKGTSTNKEQMSISVADAAIRLFARNLKKHQPPVARVTLYGGEPTLNKNLLFFAIPLIRSLNYPGQKQPIEILCFTNGLIYDEAVTRMFLKHNVGVGLSLDGMETHHNTSRKSLGGKDTFRRVVETYHRYRQAGARVGVSCTIGKHNYQSLPEIVEYFHRELKIPSLQLQVPIQMTGGRNPLYVEMKEAARKALDAFKYLRNNAIEEGLGLRRVTPFSEGRFHYRDCLGVGGELAVAPDGRLGPCHNAISSGESFSCGNVLEADVDFDHNRLFAEWHARMPMNMATCTECPFIALCGGGCPYNAFLHKGSIWEIDPQQCGYMEQFVNWLLEDVWERYRASTLPFYTEPALRKGRQLP